MIFWLLKMVLQWGIQIIRYSTFGLFSRDLIIWFYAL
jgi:hypothetical protein